MRFTTSSFCFAFVAVIISSGILSCNEERQPVVPPQQLDDGWVVSTPEQEDMDNELLNEAISQNADNKYVDAFVVARNGRLVAEAYYNGYAVDKPHKVWSVTKAVAAAIMGIVVMDSAILSEQDYIRKYMGDYERVMSEDKNGITIEHLLTMTSGIDWVELGGRKLAGFRVAYSPDWIEFVLRQPQAAEPGARFNYSSGDYMLLAPVVKNATGKQVDEYADEHLFSPLGITNYEWIKCSEFWTKAEGGEMPNVQKPDPPIEYPEYFMNYPATASGLKMLPRDMARIGQLYLNKGNWNGRQVLPEDWVEQSVQPHPGNEHYGYGWHLLTYTVHNKETKCYHARGFGLQSIYVFPEYELVVVFTQQNYRTMQEGDRQTQDILQNYVLKAVRK